MNPVIVYTCDAWKSTKSLNLVGVFTNRKKLLQVLHKLYKSNEIDVDGNPSTLKNLTLKQMQVKIEYLYLEEIELNEDMS